MDPYFVVTLDITCLHLKVSCMNSRKELFCSAVRSKLKSPSIMIFERVTPRTGRRFKISASLNSASLQVTS